MKKLLAFFVMLALMVVLVACGGSNDEKIKEEEWLSNLEQYKKEVEEAYTLNDPQEKATQAQELADQLDEATQAIMDETGETQTNNDLIRAYVCVTQMAKDVKHMAEDADPTEAHDEYFQANGEAEQIIRDLQD